MSTSDQVGGWRVNETIAGHDLTGLPEKLRRLCASAAAARELAEDDKAARNAAIYEASTAGWSLNQIARATGIHRATVHRIIIDEESKAWGPG